MPELSQTGRPLRVDTSLGKDVLLLAGLHGRESVSGLFDFRLSLLSTESGIKAQDMLGTAMVVTLELPDGGERKIHGLVRRFAQLEREELVTAYEAEIVPWLWLLSLNRDSRVFQDMNAVEIIEKVFHDRGQSDFEVKCSGSPPKREYCVQYRESDFQFVSRLMEEEGIYYFFEHADSKHTLVLGDAPSHMPDCPGGTKARFLTQHAPGEDAVAAVRRESAVTLGKVSLRAYDYTQPSLSLESSLSGKGQGEFYDYPGRFTSMEAGDHDAGLILESRESLRDVVRGESSCRNFCTGHSFELEGHFASEANAKYALIELEHDASVSGYFAGASDGYDYRNSFLAIPANVKYRPPRSTPQPVVRGSQTALVVGPSGEEIYVDKYGRVKVQFFWDREGKKDEKSSCWVRVSSSWAGKGWGSIQLPRIGQEVIVDFLEGDPDRPIITGRVYNAEQMPPYELPSNQTVSGVKSRSSKAGGAETCNEIRMEDKKGSELLLIHAERDKQVEVENDRTETVGNDESITIKGNRTAEVDKDEKVTVKGDRTATVEGNEDLTIEGDETRKVEGSDSLKVEGRRSAKITGDAELSTEGKLTLGAMRAISMSSKAGAVKVESPEKIELKVGPSSIVIDPSGITVKGMKVSIEGTVEAELKAVMTTVKAEGVLEVSANAVANVTSSGIMVVRGSLVTIN